jgi:hypothetical protein
MTNEQYKELTTFVNNVIVEIEQMGDEYIPAPTVVHIADATAEDGVPEHVRSVLRSGWPDNPAHVDSVSLVNGGVENLRDWLRARLDLDLDVADLGVPDTTENWPDAAFIVLGMTREEVRAEFESRV